MSSAPHVRRHTPSGLQRTPFKKLSWGVVRAGRARGCARAAGAERELGGQRQARSRRARRRGGDVQRAERHDVDRVARGRVRRERGDADACVACAIAGAATPPRSGGVGCEPRVVVEGVAVVGVRVAPVGGAVSSARRPRSVFATELRTTTISKTRAQRAPPRSSEAPVATTGERASLSRRVSMAVKPVAAPPPRRDVEDRAGTLRGQLRALSEAVLRGADDARSRASTSGRDARARDAAVRRLQGRAFEVLLRLDATVDAGKPPTAAERARRTTPSASAPISSPCARAAPATPPTSSNASWTPSPRDPPRSFRTRRTPTPDPRLARARTRPAAIADRAPETDPTTDSVRRAGPAPSARTRRRDVHRRTRRHRRVTPRPRGYGSRGARRRREPRRARTAQNLERLSSAFARLAATDADSRDDTAAARRAERACAWLSLAPASILESTPRFGRRDEGFAAAEDVVVAPALPRFGSDVEMDAPPRGGRSRSERSRLDRTVAGSIARRTLRSSARFPRRTVRSSARSRDREFEPEPSRERRRVGRAPRRPPRGEGGFLDPAWLADRRAGDIFTPEREDSNDSNPNPNPSETRDVRRDEEASPSDAKGDAEAWLAAATCSSSSNAPTLGWDLGDMRPACGAFMTRGSRAFGRAYDAHLRPAARLFSGGAGPATATEEELVASASRALAGERAATSAIRTDAFGSRERPSLRLPAASAGAVAATLAPLATAAERRAALDAFARDSSGFGIGRGFQGSRGLGSASLRVCESASLRVSPRRRRRRRRARFSGRTTRLCGRFPAPRRDDARRSERRARRSRPRTRASTKSDATAPKPRRRRTTARTPPRAPLA